MVNTLKAQGTKKRKPTQKSLDLAYVRQSIARRERVFASCMNTPQMQKAVRHYEAIVACFDETVEISMPAFNARIRSYCEQHGLDELMVEAIVEVKLDRMLKDCDNKMPTHGESW